jgi:subtilisin family serine protease
MEFSSVDLVDFEVDDAQDKQETYSQYGRDALNIDAAWALTGGGYALVADIDSGLYVNSPWLRQFAGSQYVGGNFIPVASLDVSGRGLKPQPLPDDPNVDERRPVLITDPNCSPGGPSMMSSILAGHGTHTAGLIAANGSAGQGVQGTCKNCGIAMWKVAYATCSPLAHQVVPNYNPAANAAALGIIGDIGAGVANMSFGGDRIPNYCATLTQNSPPDDTAMCLAIAHNALRDVAMVGAAGNQRKRLQFPANDDRVIAAGGFQLDLSLWDDSPGSNALCPYPDGRECGSCWTTPANGPKQELMASAKSVLSTTYPGFNWNTQVKCGDGFGPGGGTGLCTGTSMSAPQISGLVGLVRSINPLVAVGKPTFNPLSEKASVRSVIASTTAEAQANQAWTPEDGIRPPRCCGGGTQDARQGRRSLHSQSRDTAFPSLQHRRKRLRRHDVAANRRRPDDQFDLRLAARGLAAECAELSGVPARSR